MSMIRKAVTALIVLSVLAFQSVSRAEALDSKQVGHTSLVGAVVSETRTRVGEIATALITPAVDIKELQCLARNIFFEAANEPEEGKVAVGLVTLNRVQDGRFRDTVCGVVDERTTRLVERQATRQVRESPFRVRTEIYTTWEKRTICQFSWRCMAVRNPKSDDARWIESQQIARDLLEDPLRHAQYLGKYDDALWFHATYVRPSWAAQKKHVGRVGGHHFYKERKSNQPQAF
jgi:N-acetylmuramoyl-L-alanine amidase